MFGKISSQTWMSMWNTPTKSGDRICPSLQWVNEQAREEWPNSTESINTLRLDWYGQRTTEVIGIWEEVFGTSEERIQGVIGAQAANLTVGERVLEYAWSSGNESHEDLGVDAIAIAPYFGRYLGGPDTEAEVESWTTTIQMVDSIGCFRNSHEGGVLSNGPAGGALEQSYQNIENYANLAEEEGLLLVANEGGQTLAGFRGVENNENIELTCLLKRTGTLVWGISIENTSAHGKN